MDTVKMYYIKKRGYYYRVDSKGYTSEKSEAGQYTWAEVLQHTGSCSELTYEPITIKR